MNQVTKRACPILWGKKMADTYQNMTILTSGREFEDQWERVHAPVIKKKYQNMRNNTGNDIRETYFCEFQVCKYKVGMVCKLMEGFEMQLVLGGHYTQTTTASILTLGSVASPMRGLVRYLWLCGYVAPLRLLLLYAG
jgi:hypothetical protein